jgi:hypothetical protein
VKPTQFLQKVTFSGLTPLVLFGAIGLDFNRPGYLTFWNPIDLIPVSSWGNCPSNETLTVGVPPWLQSGLSQKSTIDQWKRRLGEPVCKEEDQYTWKIPGGFYLKIWVDPGGNVTKYIFLRA